jgi:RHS repeat-associated protein
VTTGSQSDVDFTGMRPDTQTGLYDFPAREYSTVGRWISPDPAGLNAVDITNPQSWNRYAYALNNPLGNVEPTGLDCVTVDGDGNVTGTEGGDCPDINPNNEYYINCDDCLDDVTFVGRTGYDAQGNPVAFFPSNYDYLLANVTGSWLCGGNCPGFGQLNLLTQTSDPAANNGTPQNPQQPQQPSKLKKALNCVTTALPGQLQANTSQLGSNLKYSFTAGPLLGVGACTAVVISEPYLAPSWPGCSVLAATSTTTIMASGSVLTWFIGNMASTVGTVYYCGKNELGGG